MGQTQINGSSCRRIKGGWPCHFSPGGYSDRELEQYIENEVFMASNLHTHMGAVIHIIMQS